MAKGEVRAKMVGGAVRLLAERGMEGTSFAEVLELVDAPRGSTYHHFPGGKRELVDAALEVAGGHALAAMEALRGRPAAEVLARFLDLWRQLLSVSEMRAGCAVVAVTVAGSDAELVEHAGRIFAAWRAQMASLLCEGGLAPTRADGLAALIISACEGAVAVARAERDMAAFELVAEQLERLVAGGT
jgi:TetR/AcrR family transcriptional repressor of lmrAB and yxaGH operons